MSDSADFSVCVIGAGPAGLNAALVLGRMCHDVIVLDGGVGRNATSPSVQNVLFHAGKSPEQFAAEAWAELSGYSSVVRVRAVATSVAGQRDAFTVTSDDGSTARARRLVLATGVRDELPPIAGVSELWGSGVLHCAYCDGWELRGQPIAVLVTRQQDVTRAARMTRISSDVIACVDPSFELAPEDSDFLAAGGIRIRQSAVIAVRGTRSDRLSAVVLADGEVLARRALFLHPTTQYRGVLPDQLGCRLVSGRFVEVDDQQRTNVDGVLAAGDMTRKAADIAKPEQVTVAAAEGVTAGMVVDHQLTSAAHRALRGTH